MNWKNRLTNYNFWISIVSAILLILQAFKFEFDVLYINEVATAVLGLLVVIGIISDPTKAKQSEKSQSVEEKAKNEPEIPSDKENEINDVFNKDDFKVLLEQISQDIQNKLNIANSINVAEDISISEKESEKQVTNEEIEQPCEQVEETILTPDIEEHAESLETQEIVEAEESMQETSEEIEVNIQEVKEEKIECYNIVNN